MVLAAPLCGIDTEPSSPTAGIKKDFGVLKGLQLTANDKGYEYTLNLCSTSSQKCPDDPDHGCMFTIVILRDVKIIRIAMLLAGLH